MKLTITALVLAGLGGILAMSGSPLRAADAPATQTGINDNLKALQNEAGSTGQQVKQEAIQAEKATEQKVKQTVADKKAKLKARSAKGDTMKQRKAKLKKTAQDKMNQGAQKATGQVEKAEGKANDAVNKALGQ